MRLIDADEFKKYISAECIKMQGAFKTEKYRKLSISVIEGICMDIDKAPTVDAEPVMRCCNCKYMQETHYEDEGEPPYIKRKCTNKYAMNNYMVHKDDFCSRGERREQIG